jgi:ribosomal RNA assembly protein
MMQSVRIPTERVGVLIGKNGETKSRIEKLTGVRISVDSEEGDIQIDYTHAKDPAMALSVTNVVTAIGRGFSPGKAMKLLREDYFFDILDIRDYVEARARYAHARTRHWDSRQGERDNRRAHWRPHLRLR